MSILISELNFSILMNDPKLIKIRPKVERMVLLFQIAFRYEIFLPFWLELNEFNNINFKYSFFKTSHVRLSILRYISLKYQFFLIFLIVSLSLHTTIIIHSLTSFSKYIKK